MLVVGPLLQIAAFLVQFLHLPFPIFALSFGLGGIGRVFQVSIIYYISVKNYDQWYRYRMHLRMASSRLFKKTLNINWALYRQHMVQLFPNNPFQKQNKKTKVFTIHRRWSISCSSFRNLLFSINVLVVSLPCVAFPSHLESCPSYWSV